ncbi:antibiotic biosynthesis monooxygenase family protein [Oceanobacillus halotolerans]|uniref:antibiotic biosynthesis monooxygenase family protein n=1 Tax=Oceanobacillus halotolerans TaxID=2663380 RepID=UPI0013DACF75|nr:antibiotic biosynthesis monooxygenase [Oceanobacillus halotolerans]
MKAFMTNGTIDFLQKLQQKHANLDFFFMNSHEGSLAYYEGTGKSVFTAGREYEILIQKGAVKQEGYVVMNNIPVTEDGKPVFEDRFKKRQQDVDGMPGFQAFRLLKPTKGNTYVVFTQWESEKDFKNWKNSAAFQQAHQDQGTKPPAYFADRPFVTKYHMVDQEELN